MNQKIALKTIENMNDSEAIACYVEVMAVALGSRGELEDLRRFIGPLCRIALAEMAGIAEAPSLPLEGIVH